MSDGVIANLKATVEFVTDTTKALASIRRLEQAYKDLARNASDRAALGVAGGAATTAKTIIGGVVGGVATGGNPAGIMAGAAIGGSIGAGGTAAALRSSSVRDQRMVEMLALLDVASTKLRQTATDAGPLAKKIADVQKASSDLVGLYSTAARLSEGKTIKKADFGKFQEALTALDARLEEYRNIVAMVKRERPSALNAARWPEGTSIAQLKTVGENAQANRAVADARSEAERQRRMADATDARTLAVRRAAQAEINMAQAIRLAIEADAERERNHRTNMQLMREREEYTRRIGVALKNSQTVSPQPFQQVSPTTAMDAAAVKAQAALRAAVDQTAVAYGKMQASAANAGAAAAAATENVKRRLLDMVRIRPFEADIRRKQALENEAKAADSLGNSLSRAQERMVRLGESFQNIGQFSQAAFGPMANWLNRIGTIGMALQQLGNGGIGGGGGAGGGGGLFGGFGGSAVVATIGISGLFAALTRFHSEAVRVGKVLEPIENALNMVKGSGEKAGESFKLLTDLSLKYGLSMTELARPFMGLKVSMEGTAMAGDKFKEFMRDFSAISGNLSLLPSQIAGAAKAFEQMFSKGTVQAEEFRHQLGDRWPAAMRAGMEAYRKMTNSQETDTTKLMNAFMGAMKNREVVSVAFLRHFMTEYKAMLGLVGGKENEAVQNINASLNRLSTSWDIMIRNLDKASGWTKIYSAALNVLSDMFTAVSNAAGGTMGTIIQLGVIFTGLGTVLVGLNFAYVIGGMMGLGTAVTGFLAASGALLSRLGVLGIAITTLGVAMYALSDPATAALADIDKLDKRYAQFQETLAKAPLSANSPSGSLLANDLAVKLSQLEEAKRAVQEKLDAATKAYDAEIQKTALTGSGQFAKMQAELRASLLRTVSEHSNQLAVLEANEQRVRATIESVGAAQKKVSEKTAKAAEAARQYEMGARSVADLEKEAKQLEGVLSTLSTEGLAAAKAQQALNAELASAGGMAAAAAGKLDEYTVQMKKVIALRDQVASAMTKAAAAESGGLSGGTGSGGTGRRSGGGGGGWRTSTESHQKYEDIISRADMIMEGRGREADATRKLEVEVRKYEEALRKVGEAEDSVIAKSGTYRQALVDRANGVDYSARKFDVLPMMNRHFDSTVDKLAELMVTGEMSGKKLKEVFASMAQSIIKDLIAMSLKMTVVMPIMQQMSRMMGPGGGNLGNLGGGGGLFGGSGGSGGGFWSGLFGGGGSGGSGSGSWGSTAFSGGLYAKGSAFSDGGVVDTPTSFMTNKGRALMGEANDEAVMPLVRGPGGRLSVQAVGGDDSKSSPVEPINVALTINNPTSDSVQQLKRDLPKLIITTVSDARSRRLL